MFLKTDIVPRKTSRCLPKSKMAEKYIENKVTFSRLTHVTCGLNLYPMHILVFLYFFMTIGGLVRPKLWLFLREFILPRLITARQLQVHHLWSMKVAVGSNEIRTRDLRMAPYFSISCHHDLFYWRLFVVIALYIV